ncbi:PREDICTED: receptor-transporting protein 3 [Condylura cristata]|uniref:receptor-transporting protein 3 n=1 Tax=Condylura cristata TaxID=143302 RepID=UPI0003346C31|nr:PREDICTED: receptor-transporting protein 3 [Condylura cristata]
MGQDIEEWKQEFQALIQEVKPGHRWTLTVDKCLLPNNLKPRWMQYQQHTFARFQCSVCSRSWASARVQVLFHLRWNEEASRGEVKMRVFAQKCQKCSQAPFEAPQIMKENISRILNNLVLHILKKCYKEGFKLVEIPVIIKEVSHEGPHDSHNCEACLQGLCAESRSGPVVQSPAFPALPPISSQPGGVTPQKPFPIKSSPMVETIKTKKEVLKHSPMVETEKRVPKPSPIRSSSLVETEKRVPKPSPIRSSTLVETEKRVPKPSPIRSSSLVETEKKEKRLPRPRPSGPSQSVRFPTYWSPGVHTSHHVVPPSWELPPPHMTRNSTRRRLHLCCCVLLIVIITITVTVLLNTL